MNTSLETRRPLLRRHTEIVGGVLVAALFAVAYWLSGPTLVILLPFDSGSYEGVESGAAMVPYLLAIAVAAYVAFTSVSPAAKSLFWIVLAFAWIATFMAYFIYDNWVFENGESGHPGWVVAVAETSIVVWMAVPLVLFLLVCWRLPRPRVDTYVAEVALLALIALYLYNYFSAYDIEGVPLEPILVSVGVAAYFGFAAWLVPTRRIVYGAVALAGIAVAACSARLFALDNGNYAEGEFTPQNLLDLLLIGIPAIGLVLQIVWHQRRKARGEVPVDAVTAE
jgi:hypothetical protein